MGFPSRAPMDDADVMVGLIEQGRRERGISVAELGRRIGVDRKRLWRVLNGERAMRVDEFVRLCAFFGMGVGMFVPTKPARGVDLDAPLGIVPSGNPSPSLPSSQPATRHSSRGGSVVS